jgi:hypothetical protein
MSLMTNGLCIHVVQKPSVLIVTLTLIRYRLMTGRFSVGQNLASASYDLDWSSVVKLWYDEVKDFTLGGSNSLVKVGHYTQVTSILSHPDSHYTQVTSR